MTWQSVPCLASELNLRVLSVGQSFRWKKLDDRIWQGIAKNRVWQLYRENDKLFYRVLAQFQDYSNDHFEILSDYFNLKYKLSDMRKIWLKTGEDEYFEKVLEKQQGVRILRQHPVECLFSFICSSNNNIKRISSMVENLCSNFGESVTITDDEKTTKFFNFPTVKSLATDDVEEILRNLNFGYRARYVAETASKLLEIDENPDDFLLELRNKPYDECRRRLMNFSGVGGKVADCVCLMSLDKHEVVPVDTHVLQVTAQHYLPEIKKLKNAVNDKTHKMIGNFYREKFGNFAGWAQAVLFANELE